MGPDAALAVCTSTVLRLETEVNDVASSVARDMLLVSGDALVDFTLERVLIDAQREAAAAGLDVHAHTSRDWARVWAFMCSQVQTLRIVDAVERFCARMLKAGCNLRVLFMAGYELNGLSALPGDAGASTTVDASEAAPDCGSLHSIRSLVRTCVRMHLLRQSAVIVDDFAWTQQPDADAPLQPRRDAVDAEGERLHGGVCHPWDPAMEEYQDAVLPSGITAFLPCDGGPMHPAWWAGVLPRVPAEDRNDVMRNLAFARALAIAHTAATDAQARLLAIPTLLHSTQVSWHFGMTAVTTSILWTSLRRDGPDDVPLRATLHAHAKAAALMGAGAAPMRSPFSQEACTRLVEQWQRDVADSLVRLPHHSFRHAAPIIAAGLQGAPLAGVDDADARRLVAVRSAVTCALTDSLTLSDRAIVLPVGPISSVAAQLMRSGLPTIWGWLATGLRLLASVAAVRTCDVWDGRMLLAATALGTAFFPEAPRSYAGITREWLAARLPGVRVADTTQPIHDVASEVTRRTQERRAAVLAAWRAVRLRPIDPSNLFAEATSREAAGDEERPHAAPAAAPALPSVEVADDWEATADDWEAAADEAEQQSADAAAAAAIDANGLDRQASEPIEDEPLYADFVHYHTGALLNGYNDGLVEPMRVKKPRTAKQEARDLAKKDKLFNLVKASLIGGPVRDEHVSEDADATPAAKKHGSRERVIEEASEAAATCIRDACNAAARGEFDEAIEALQSYVPAGMATTHAIPPAWHGMHPVDAITESDMHVLLQYLRITFMRWDFRRSPDAARALFIALERTLRLLLPELFEDRDSIRVAPWPWTRIAVDFARPLRAAVTSRLRRRIAHTERVIAALEPAQKRPAKGSAAAADDVRAQLSTARNELRVLSTQLEQVLKLPLDCTDHALLAEAAAWDVDAAFKEAQTYHGVFVSLAKTEDRRWPETSVKSPLAFVLHVMTTFMGRSPLQQRASDLVQRALAASGSSLKPALRVEIERCVADAAAASPVWDGPRFQLENTPEHLPRPEGIEDTRVAFIPDVWQQRVLNVIDEGRSALIVAPTSAGKTFASFYAAKKLLLEKTGGRGVMVIVAPTKALVSQIGYEIESRFVKRYDGRDVIVSGQFTRDHRVNEKQCQVLITVPQMLETLLLSAAADGWIGRLRRIVFDEVHNMMGPDGSVWERLLAYSHVPILAMSATIGNAETLHAWLQRLEVRRYHGLADMKKPPVGLTTHPSEVELIRVPYRFNALTYSFWAPRRRAATPAGDDAPVDNGEDDVRLMSRSRQLAIARTIATAGQFVPVELGDESVSATDSDVGVHSSAGLVRVHPAAYMDVSSLRRGVVPDVDVTPEEFLALLDSIIDKLTTRYGTDSPLLAPFLALQPSASVRWSNGLRVTQAEQQHQAKRLLAALTQLAAAEPDVVQEVVDHLKAPLAAAMVASDEALSEQTQVRFLHHQLRELVAHLDASGKCPVIVFHMSRKGCERLAKKLGHDLMVAQLRDLSRKYGAPGSPERLAHVHRVEAKIRELQRQQAAAAKREMAAKAKDDDDEHITVSSTEIDEQQRLLERLKGLAHEADFVEHQHVVAPGFRRRVPTWEDIGDRAGLGDWRMKQMLDDQRVLPTAAQPVPELGLWDLLRRGIGVHHSGLPAQYRTAVEVLYRERRLPVLLATSTLAQGINMPCRTVVMAGDNVYLNAMNFRQMAGRAGRRGMDLRGDVIMLGIPSRRAMRLLESSVPGISPAWTTGMSHMLRILVKDQSIAAVKPPTGSGAKDRAVAVEIDVAKRIARPSLQRQMEDTFIQLVAPHAAARLRLQQRFTLEVLRRLRVMNEQCQPMGLAALVQYLHYCEPANFILVSMLQEGVLQQIVADVEAAASIAELPYCNGGAAAIASTPSDAALDNALLGVLSFLLFRKAPALGGRPAGANGRVTLRLEDLAPAAATHLRKYDDLVRSWMRGYCYAYALEASGADHRGDMLGLDRGITPDIRVTLPLSGTELPSAELQAEIGAPSAPHVPAVLLSPLSAMSGKDELHLDNLPLRDELEAYRAFLAPDIAGVPCFPGLLDPVNRFILDFYAHGQRKLLISENRLDPDEVYDGVRDFSFAIRAIGTALARFVIDRGWVSASDIHDDDDEVPEDERAGDAAAAAAAPDEDADGDADSDGAEAPAAAAARDEPGTSAAASGPAVAPGMPDPKLYADFDRMTTSFIAAAGRVRRAGVPDQAYKTVRLARALVGLGRRIKALEAAVSKAQLNI